MQKLILNKKYSIPSILYFVTSIVLLIVQSWLIHNGVNNYGKFKSPYILTVISTLIAIIYLIRKRRLEPLILKSSRNNKKNLNRPYIWAFFSAVISLLSYEELRKLFEWSYPNPEQYSDVVPQIEWLFSRFARGDYPYVPVDTIAWEPFPVYMPLHWLPVGISEIFAIDSRWSGYIILVLTCSIAGYWIGKVKSGWFWKILALATPHIGLWHFIISKDISMPVSFELPIMAYYLLLGIGLISGRNYILTIGLISCILSRYTLFFWLPLFAILYFSNRGKAESIRLWGFVVLAGVLLYVIPFMSKDLNVLLKGISYHNEAVAAEWAGYGAPPISWTHEKGIYFAPHFKELFIDKEPGKQAKLMRYVQLIIMGILILFGLFLSRLKNSFWHWRHLCLVLLYFMIVMFYLFSPLTYPYYYLVVTILSSVLTMDLIPTKELKLELQ